MEKKLLYDFFRCETTPEQDKEIMDWLDMSAANRQEFERERVVFNSIALHAPITAGKQARKKRANSPLLSRRILKYAASAAAVFFLLGGGYLLSETSNRKIMEMTTKISVPAGQRISMTLSDGTVIWLNSGTEIEYPSVFAKDARRVRINGEALFDVTHNPKHPFIVETFACNVEVLGTKFNVAANDRKERFSAALMEGRVKVVNTRSGESIYMNPDEEVELVNGLLRKNIIDDPDEYRWPEGIISLRNASFAELMDKFEKYYDVDIVIDRVNMPQISHIGKIRVSDGIDHALRLLQEASDFTYTKDSETNKIVIR